MTKILIACIPGIIAGMLAASISLMLKVRQERTYAEEVFRLLKETANYAHRCKVIEEEIESSPVLKKRGRSTTDKDFIAAVKNKKGESR